MQELENVPEIRVTKKANIRKLRAGNKKSNFIPPMSVAKFLKTNKRTKEAMAMDILEKENDETGETRDNSNTEGCHDLQLQIGQDLEREDACSYSEPLNGDTLMNVAEEEELDISIGKVGKKRGTVYCRKLTLLPPGEKLNVEFDEDGVAIGDNASLFSFFLGQQVRNKSVCPIQVKGRHEYTSEVLDHLWACIQNIVS